MWSKCETIKTKSKSYTHYTVTHYKLKTFLQIDFSMVAMDAGIESASQAAARWYGMEHHQQPGVRIIYNPKSHIT